jgi:hypothetical protein
MPDSCRGATSCEPAPGMPLPFGANAVVRSAVVELYECPARSARTRRSVVSSRWRPLVRGAENGVVRNRRSIKYCDFHIQHCNNLPVPPQLLAASCPLACSPIQTCLPRLDGFRHSRRGGFCADLSCSTTARHRCLDLREISTQNHNTHIAMGHDPTIAWKAPPTRTPPPICTSAPFLKPRWSQDRGRCEPIKKYTMGDFPQSI